MQSSNNKLKTGSISLDGLLEGGFESGVVTTIFGPSGSGKSNICLLALAHHSDKRCVYIDTEGSFSVARLKQLTGSFEAIMQKSIFFTPTDFDEQKKVFSKLDSVVSKGVDFILVDSIAMLYRLELGKSKDVYNVNRELGVQLASLLQVSRKFEIPVIITNQVYADFEDKSKINMIGGDILRYASKCLIELKKEKEGPIKEAILRKHRSIKEGKCCKFKIVNEGILTA